MLGDILEKILKNKMQYAGAKTGELFEDQLKSLFKAEGFTEIRNVSKTRKVHEQIMLLEGIDSKSEKYIFKDLKSKIIDKKSTLYFPNPFVKIKNSFIFQPFGSQQYPDFLMITEENIIPIEVKFSKTATTKEKIKAKRPKWNSNLPKANGFYIYGINATDITYFIGADILGHKSRVAMVEYFAKLDEIAIELNDTLESLENKHGFAPKVRVDYHQLKKSSSINSIPSLFGEDRYEREKNFINVIKKLK